ncbi:MAG TPA: class I SAM-dependent methyltransferase [Lutibacter sp.]|nr:class I SAM-dependent methyltransferase [Lutibacter sp.]
MFHVEHLFLKYIFPIFTSLNKNTLKVKLICKDYTVSNEKFELLYNSELEMLVTNPKPSDTKLPTYYKSESYISHTDAKKSLFDKTYQLVKSYALGQKVKMITSFKTKEKRLLDIGCGTGDFISYAKNKSWNVVGVEPNKKARELSIKKLNDTDAIYTSLENLVDSKQEKFDVITLWHVLEHVPDIDKYIKQTKSLLKSDGYLVVAVPNYKSYDATHYKEFWAAYDVPRHLWHFSQKSIARIFEKENMKVIQTLPMKFDSYYVSLLSEKYKTGKSNLFTAFKIGFLSNWKARKTKEYSSLIYILKTK